MVYDAAAEQLLPDFAGDLLKSYSSGQMIQKNKADIMSAMAEARMKQGQANIFDQITGNNQPQQPPMQGGVPGMQSGVAGITDPNTLQKYAMVNPEGAKTILESQKYNRMYPQGSAFFGGTFEDQGANMQVQKYLKAGYPQDQAIAMAYNDVNTSKQNAFTDATGQTHLITNKPLPTPGGLPSPQMGQGMPPSLPGEDQGGLPNAVDPNANVYSQPEQDFAGKVMSVPPEQRAEAYTQAIQDAKDAGHDTADLEAAHPGFNPTIEQHFAGIAKGMPASPANVALGSPKVSVEAQAEQEKKAGDIADEAGKQAVEAAQTMPDVKQVYNIYDRYKGGKLADVQALWQRTKGSVTNLTPEENQSLSDYTQLQQFADRDVLGSLKASFPGRVTNTDLNFMDKVQAQPGDLGVQARNKAAIAEGTLQMKIDYGKFLSDWKGTYGKFSAEDTQGRNAQAAYTDWLKDHPVMTPAFFAQRGIAVPAQATGGMFAEQVVQSLPSGSRIYDPSTKRNWVRK